ncbi:MAG: hypothetical protein QXY40_09495 [Candidatus Methanomethylicia archaeon]
MSLHAISKTIAVIIVAIIIIAIIAAIATIMAPPTASPPLTSTTSTFPISPFSTSTTPITTHIEPELEMEYLGRKINTTGWIPLKPSPMSASMSISKDSFNVKPGDKVEVGIYAWIFQPIKEEPKKFIFEVYKESSKIGEFNFTVEHEGSYYEGVFRLTVKAPLVEGEYSYSVVWMGLKMDFRVVVKKS